MPAPQSRSRSPRRNADTGAVNHTPNAADGATIGTPANAPLTANGTSLSAGQTHPVRNETAIQQEISRVPPAQRFVKKWANKYYASWEGKPVVWTLLDVHRGAAETTETWK